MSSPVKILNASGYAFQLRVAHEVQQTANAIRVFPWRVCASEYAWTANGEPAFIDLILGNRDEGLYFVVECKRTRGGTWVFPSEAPQAQVQETRHLYLEAPFLTDPDQALRGWLNAETLPESLAVEFCAVKGTGEGQVPTLEAICRRLIDASEAFVSDLLAGTDRQERAVYRWSVYPLVVTNAKLMVCAYLPHEIDLETGDLRESANSVMEVPWVRFHKTLAAPSRELLESERSIEIAQADAERTVFVVNASHLVEFLNRFRASR